MRLRLVVPPDVDQPTGGNVYDLALARELARAGHVVEIVRCRSAELSDVVRRPWDGSTLIDGAAVNGSAGWCAEGLGMKLMRCSGRP